VDISSDIDKKKFSNVMVVLTARELDITRGNDGIGTGNVDLTPGNVLDLQGSTRAHQSSGQACRWVRST
jgi:hypothetical protein